MALDFFRPDDFWIRPPIAPGSPLPESMYSACGPGASVGYRIARPGTRSRLEYTGRIFRHMLPAANQPIEPIRAAVAHWPSEISKHGLVAIFLPYASPTRTINFSSGLSRRRRILSILHFQRCIIEGQAIIAVSTFRAHPPASSSGCSPLRSRSLSCSKRKGFWPNFFLLFLFDSVSAVCIG
ncbi:hypothetical protein BC567DRAFT_27182 [Phyllosticta citribraziliensis]